MSWTIGLDRYLTSGPPDDGFDNWCEQTTEALSHEFFENNEDWVLDSDLCNDWLNKLFHKSPQEAAGIIERAHRLYGIKN